MVAKFTVTLVGLGRDSRTLNTTGVTPLLPSVTVTSDTLRDGRSTVLTNSARLFPASPSASARAMATRFVICPAADGTVTTAIVAAVPAARRPRAHSTRLPTSAQLPCDEATETKEADGGRKFVAIIPV